MAFIKGGSGGHADETSLKHLSVVERRRKKVQITVATTKPDEIIRISDS